MTGVKPIQDCQLQLQEYSKLTGSHSTLDVMVLLQRSQAMTLISAQGN
jgi:hypothetical protein